MINNIEFPNLGIKMELNRVAFEIFGKEVYWYGVLIGIGFILAVLFAFRRRERYDITPDNIFDFILIGLPSAIVGARFVYVIGDPSCRSGGFAEWIAVWDGGLSIYGGLGFAVLACLIYLKRKNMNILRTLDFAAPSFMIGQMVGRWGNFVNAEVYGRETSSFLGMKINGAEMVHPLFLYEMLWMLVAFIALVLYSKKNKHNGEIFSFYLIWYGIGRIWMESMRDEVYVLRIFNLPLSIILSVSIIIIGALTLIYTYTDKKKDTDEAKDSVEDDEENENTINEDENGVDENER